MKPREGPVSIRPLNRWVVPCVVGLRHLAEKSEEVYSERIAWHPGPRDRVEDVVKAHVSQFVARRIIKCDKEALKTVGVARMVTTARSSPSGLNSLS